MRCLYPVARPDYLNYLWLLVDENWSSMGGSASGGAILKSCVTDFCRPYLNSPLGASEIPSPCSLTSYETRARCPRTDSAAGLGNDRAAAGMGNDRAADKDSHKACHIAVPVAFDTDAIR